MTLIIPQRLADTCSATPERRAWLEQLPAAVREVQERWSLSVGDPFAHNEGSCAWVAAVVRSDGTRAVLKMGMPHMEATHEIQGLRFWAGDPAVICSKRMRISMPCCWSAASRASCCAKCRNRNRMSSSPGCCAVSGAKPSASFPFVRSR